MGYCVVPHCSNRTGHYFPKQREIRRRWINAVNRKNWKPSNYSIVCREHFKEDDYIKDRAYSGGTPLKKVLKKGVVPSVFIWKPRKTVITKRQERYSDRQLFLSQITTMEIIKCEDDEVQVASDSNVTKEIEISDEQVEAEETELPVLISQSCQTMATPRFGKCGARCRCLKRTAVPHTSTVNQGFEQSQSCLIEEEESCVADDASVDTMSGENTEEGTRFAPKKRKVVPGSGGRNCCVCRKNDQFNRDLTFHTFPTKGKTFVFVRDKVSGVLQKKDRLTLWCEFAKVDEAHTKTLSLCSLHFKRQDYLPDDGSDKMFRCLKKIAVPSIFNVGGKGCQNVESQPTTHNAELKHEMSSTEEVAAASGTSHANMSQGNSESFEHVVVKQEPNTDVDSGIKDPLNEFEHVVIKEEPIDIDSCNNDSMIFEHVDVKQEPLDAGNIPPNAGQEQVNESLPQFEHISVKEESIENIEFIETEPENFEITHNDAQENPLTTSNFDSHISKESTSSFISKDHQNVHDHTRRYHMKCNVEETPMVLCSTLLEFLDQENTGSTHLCEICSEDFSSRTFISKHFYTRHPRYKGSGIIVRCKICKKCHRDIGILENHLKEQHPLHWNRSVEENESYQCSYCEKMSANCVVSMTGRCTHRLDFGKFTVTRSSMPGKFISFTYELKTDQVLATPQNSYTCILCDSDEATFVNEFELNLHLKTDHIDFAFRTCHICGTDCCNVMDYYDHLKSCHYGHTCAECEMLFDQHKNASDFESNLHADQTCADKACMEPFVNECSLKLHLATQHDRTLILENAFRCPICQVEFRNEKLFYAHCVPYSMLDTLCGLCNTPFHSKNERDNHIIQKHELVIQNPSCKICFVQTENSSSLDSHIMKEHNVELIHCNNCYSNVRIKPVHTVNHIAGCYVEQNLFCPLCGFICEDTQFLNNHINLEILYTENYKFQCKYCLNFFCTAMNLCCHLLNTKCKFCDLHLCGSKKLAAHIESEHSDNKISI